MKDKRILGIIPARGGSKSIPRKNIKPIAGKPLIAWTIEAAKASKLMDHFVVSTEDAEIARVSRECGAEVVDRPAELATDTADTLPVLQHVLKSIPAEIVVLLQCTSPVRSSDLIDRCIQKFLEEKADSLAAVFPDKNFAWGEERPRRQEIDPRPLDIGNVYVYRAGLILEGGRFGKKTVSVEISREEAVEIDEEFDFWLTEKILQGFEELRRLHNVGI